MLNIIIGILMVISLLAIVVFIYCAMILNKQTYKDKEAKDYIEDFLVELKHNESINKKKKIENRVDISYVIERLEDIKNEKL